MQEMSNHDGLVSVMFRNRCSNGLVAVVGTRPLQANGSKECGNTVRSNARLREAFIGAIICTCARARLVL